MLIAKGWKQYELIDLGGGEKLERWGDVILRRPDPQVIWPIDSKNMNYWNQADAHYHRNESGGGEWEFKRTLPDRWQIEYGPLQFHIRPTSFKHTGLFPEQAANWSWMMDTISQAKRPIKLLNLFGYTGGATAAAAYAGAEVVHVDAAKGMVHWAKENMRLSGLESRPVRYLTDDVIKFVQREIRRGHHYDAIVMDPPAYGRGPNGEMWKLEKDLYPFLEMCLSLLSEQPLFLLINAYSSGITPVIMNNLLQRTMMKSFAGRITTGELVLPVTLSDMVLPAGVLGRWENK